MGQGRGSHHTKGEEDGCVEKKQGGEAWREEQSNGRREKECGGGWTEEKKAYGRAEGWAG